MRVYNSARGGASVVALALAGMTAPASAAPENEKVTAWEASRTIDDDATIRTGVAKARDPLDSATSTSVIKDVEIERLSSPSLAELFRNIPGIRVEAAAGEINNAYTVRGLPLVGQGAKYLSFQEDGLPVMEYGDFGVAISDAFMRADNNVAQVESIRGGSASTFASDAPGGVINLISKTGEVEGGSVQIGAGLNYDSKRVDLDYGGHLSEKWRFHIGGFYRQGEGPFSTGYDAMRGGQIKANVTREFDGGYIRFNVKVLDDKVPVFYNGPIAITGTDESPNYSNIPGFDVRQDSVYSRNISALSTPLGPENVQDGFRIKSTALGAEARVTLADWTVTNRFRYSKQSADGRLLLPLAYFPSTIAAGALTGGLGGTVTYASGPNTGEPVDPNGAVSITVLSKTKAKDLGFVVNDLRASRAWTIGNGSLTTTGGLYLSSQKEVYDQYLAMVLQDAVGGGNSSLVNLNLPAAFGGATLTDDGVLNYGPPGSPGQTRFDVTFAKVAPYGSLNYQIGKLAIGGSIRYDYNKTTGTIARASTTFVRDVNGDGTISAPEQSVSLLVPTDNSPVNFRHGYVSYSVSANYRVSEPFSIFARYSLGGRGPSEAALSQGALDASGKLIDSSAGHDSVRQAEGGFKFRSNGIFVNLTGFYALTHELALQASSDGNGSAQYGTVSRGYRTYGAELEGGIRRGPFSLNGSATLTGGKITEAESPALVGNKPRRQSTLIYRISPQFDIDMVTLGANIIGQTESYTQDVNQLKMPGYTTVGLFAQVRPVERLVLSINASNVFDKRAYVEIFDATVPATGIGSGRALYGRLVNASARVFF